MPTPSGDRFSGATLADCLFCPPDGRRFRTQRQCAECGRPLCLVCRPAIPGRSSRCPECGGGPVEDALRQPEAAAQRLREAGRAVPFWLLLLAETTAVASGSPEDQILPE